MKTMKIKMTHKDGEVFFWTVRKFEGVWVRLYNNPRKLSGWSYTDHDGYTRTVEGNWLCLVEAFNATAEGYNFSHNLS